MLSTENRTNDYIDNKLKQKHPLEVAKTKADKRIQENKIKLKQSLEVVNTKADKRLQ